MTAVLENPPTLPDWGLFTHILEDEYKDDYTAKDRREVRRAKAALDANGSLLLARLERVMTEKEGSLSELIQEFEQFAARWKQLSNEHSSAGAADTEARESFYFFTEKALKSVGLSPALADNLYGF